MKRNILLYNKKYFGGMTYKDVFDIFSFSFQIIWKALAAGWCHMERQNSLYGGHFDTDGFVKPIQNILNIQDIQVSICKKTDQGHLEYYDCTCVF